MAKRKWYIHIDTLELRTGKEFQKLMRNERGRWCVLPPYTFAIQRPPANAPVLITTYAPKIPKDANSMLVRINSCTLECNEALQESFSVFDNVADFIKCVGTGLIEPEKVFFFIPVDWSK